jgi:hypothetical protein
MERRHYAVDEHVFRVQIDNPSAPAEVLSEGCWTPVVLTAEEVIGLVNARELTPEETEKLDLPD